MTLFSLNLTDLALSDKTHREDFFIGLFGTRAQAEAVAAHYLKQVPGFCDYDCTYRVEEKSSSIMSKGRVCLISSGSSLDGTKQRTASL